MQKIFLASFGFLTLTETANAVGIGHLHRLGPPVPILPAILFLLLFCGVGGLFSWWIIELITRPKEN